MKKVKLFENFVNEAAVLRDLEAKYSIVLDLYDNGKWLDLSRIEVPKDQRGFGIGSSVMQEICDYADQQGRKIYLTPSKDFGASSVSRLESFYKEFGFVKKPKEDFTVRHTMVRMPAGQTLESLLLEKGKKKPKTIIQKFKDLTKKFSKINSKGEDAVDKIKDLQKKQKEGKAEPSDKLSASLFKTQASIAKTDATKVALTRQQLALKQKIKTAKESEKAKKEMKTKADEIKKESLLIEASKTEATYNDYPAAATKNAQQAIDWKEKYGRDEVEAGTAVGWARANQLAKGEQVSKDVVSRMAQFNRHRKNSTIATEFKDEPWKDKGYVAWLIWGGDEGVDWAMEKMKEIEKEEASENVKALKHVKLFEQFVTESIEDTELNELIDHVFGVMDGRVPKNEILEILRPTVDEGFLDFIKGLFKNPFIRRKIGKLADELFKVRVEIGTLELEGDPVERYKEELDAAKEGDYTTTSSYDRDDRSEDVHDKKITILGKQEDAIVDMIDDLAGTSEPLLQYVKKIKLEVRMKETEMLMKVADSEVRRIMGQIRNKDQRTVKDLDRNIKDLIDSEEY
jgi:predicted GNAT family acetyltransferase